MAWPIAIPRVCLAAFGDCPYAPRPSTRPTWRVIQRLVDAASAPSPPQFRRTNRLSRVPPRSLCISALLVCLYCRTLVSSLAKLGLGVFFSSIADVDDLK
jgi:hypothetical protein